MAQQDQVTITMSQEQNQDEKHYLLKLLPKKILLTFSLLQIGFGLSAIIFQVSSLTGYLCMPQKVIQTQNHQIC